MKKMLVSLSTGVLRVRGLGGRFCGADLGQACRVVELDDVWAGGSLGVDGGGRQVWALRRRRFQARRLGWLNASTG